VLALMLVNTVVIVCQRLWIYTVGRRQSRAFVRDAAAALRDASFDQVMSVASRNDQSHVASIVAVGMTAFASAPKDLTHTEAIDAAERASQRSHNMLSARLRLGLGTLATIASSAPTRRSGGCGVRYRVCIPGRRSGEGHLDWDGGGGPGRCANDECHGADHRDFRGVVPQLSVRTHGSV